MNKTLSNLLRSAFVVVCVLCGVTATLAQTKQVVASGGVTTDAISCTIGEACVNYSAGMWASVDILTGIDGVYADGEVVVGNKAEGQALEVQLPEAMIADGAYYMVYNLQGMLLETNKIDATPYVLNYAGLLNGSTRIIVTINTSKGVVGTFKLSK